MLRFLPRAGTSVRLTVQRRGEEECFHKGGEKKNKIWRDLRYLKREVSRCVAKPDARLVEMR